MIRTLIVDDESIARKVLRDELEAFEDVEIVGEADNGQEALRLIEELRPDLVFLDLRMPLMGNARMSLTSRRKYSSPRHPRRFHTPGKS